MKTLILTALLVILATTVHSQKLVFKIEKNAFASEKPPLATDFAREFTIEISGAGCTDFKVTPAAVDPVYKISAKDAVFTFSSVPTDSSSISVFLECKEVKKQKMKINNTKKKEPEEEKNTKPEEEKIKQAEAAAAEKKRKAEEEERQRKIREANADFDVEKYFAKHQPTIYGLAGHYDRDNDKAYFLFGPDGSLFGPAPVNVDADDYIIILVAVPEAEAWQYSLDVDGTYNPTDLSLRPSETIDQAGIESIGKADEYTTIIRTFGPFTSEFAKITIMKSGDLLTTKDVRINKLYNGAFGASFITTNLEKPDFDVLPLAGGGNTINTINTGSRTLATFNYIIYWKATVEWASDKLRGKSHITRGRDVLKEADFWERLNPTFGVSLDSKWRKNLFIGATFEIARGANITGGWHYGEIQELADQNFVLGETAFTGTKADIKLTNKMDWGTFFGITLDTKIFNRFLKRN